ncbi:MAG: hypothetical protein K2O18_16870 [Oscillospiraceae bacterium]|nr:hypothetical protein [Oscillospiraceae bacterium]
MSCIVMNPESIAAIANAAATLLHCGYNYFGFAATPQMHEAFRDCRPRSFYAAEEIYKRLYAVNAAACNGRYKDHEAPVNDAAPDIDCSKYIVHQPSEYADYHYTIRPWHYHLAKLIDFWLYQTSEYDTWKDPIRTAMLDFQEELFQFIVRQSGEYFNAPEWGKL